MTLRDSVSNWIVGDSTPAGQEPSLRQSGTFPVPAVSKAPSLEELFAEKKIQKAGHGENGLGKRPYPFKAHQQTIDPAQIFSTIQRYTQPSAEASPEPLHKKQRQELTCSANAFLADFNMDNLGSLIDGQLYDSETPDVQTPSELHTWEEASGFVSRDHSLDGVEVSADISFGKRGNGNQPWQLSGVAPDKLGKMRRIAVELTTASTQPLAVRLRARISAHEERGHKSKLVLCSDDRCCTKIKVEGQRKPVIRCAERLAELELSQVELSAAHPVTQNFFLKPEWNGLGVNKSRPSFDLYVELVDCTSGKVHELLFWEVELQSHKFESSQKAKSLEPEAASLLTAVVLDPR